MYKFLFSFLVCGAFAMYADYDSPENTDSTESTDFVAVDETLSNRGMSGGMGTMSGGGFGKGFGGGFGGGFGPPRGGFNPGPMAAGGPDDLGADIDADALRRNRLGTPFGPSPTWWNPLSWPDYFRSKPADPPAQPATPPASPAPPAPSNKNPVPSGPSDPGGGGNAVGGGGVV